MLSLEEAGVLPVFLPSLADIEPLPSFDEPEWSATDAAPAEDVTKCVECGKPMPDSPPADDDGDPICRECVGGEAVATCPHIHIEQIGEREYQCLGCGEVSE